MLAELDPPVQGVIVASPANPTGTVIPLSGTGGDRPMVRCRGCAPVGATRCVPRTGLSGAPGCPAPWQTSPQRRCGEQFSKYYAMTGWRMGWLLVPAECDGRWTASPETSSPSVRPCCLSTPRWPLHPEAIAEADGHLKHYAANRETLTAGLRQLGITAGASDGAFYVYADVSEAYLGLGRCGGSAKTPADTGLAIAPGIDFDTMRGNSFVRLSFADRRGYRYGPAPVGLLAEPLRRWAPSKSSCTGSASLCRRGPGSGTFEDLRYVVEPPPHRGGLRLNVTVSVRRWRDRRCR